MPTLLKLALPHAEMIKYFANSFLATKVSFANEMYDLCLKLNLDYDKVVEYSVLDKRIGNSHLNVPGPDGDLGFWGAIACLRICQLELNFLMNLVQLSIY